MDENEQSRLWETPRNAHSKRMVTGIVDCEGSEDAVTPSKCFFCSLIYGAMKCSREGETTLWLGISRITEWFMVTKSILEYCKQ